MAHLGFLPVNSKGHLYPMSTLALHMRERGHQVTFFCIADGEDFCRQHGLDAVVVGRELFPVGYSDRVFGELGRMKGQAGVRYTMGLLAELIAMQFAEMPAAIGRARIDALVIDQFCMGGGAIADHLGLPYVHVANALLFNCERRVPPVNFGWGPETHPLALLRNSAAHALVRRMLQPVTRTIDAQRAAWGLKRYESFPEDAFRGHPQISQQPPSFEYPRRELPVDFHFAGPLHDRRTRQETEFSWERLDGRPVVYASMGTLQTGLDWIFRVIVEACEGLEVQLVLSLGGDADPARFSRLGSNAVIVPFAPQLRVLERASLCVTHAGMNTVLESLALGVPMVAIPITNDQPAVAARVAWIGAGRVIPPKRLTAARLRREMRCVLTVPGYREQARRMQQEIAGLDSIARAATVIEGILPAA